MYFSQKLIKKDQKNWIPFSKRSSVTGYFYKNQLCTSWRFLDEKNILHQNFKSIKTEMPKIKILNCWKVCCNPYLVGWIDTTDQMLPYLAVQIFKATPGSVRNQDNYTQPRSGRDWDLKKKPFGIGSKWD